MAQVGLPVTALPKSVRIDQRLERRRFQRVDRGRRSW
jgi:hypothetical protein